MMIKTLELLPRGKTFIEQIRAIIFPPRPVSAESKVVAPNLESARIVRNLVRPWRSPRSERIWQIGNPASIPKPRTPEAAFIYVVDNEEELIELYTLILKGSGYVVRGFSLRTDALALLRAERKKPDLLITDYCGLTMPVEEFMQQCLLLHPTLRILMASGLSQNFVQFSRAKPDRFLEKPFTPEEFLLEVRAALTV
jgi:CheY-like chemotaxis protein